MRISINVHFCKWFVRRNAKHVRLQQPKTVEDMVQAASEYEKARGADPGEKGGKRKGSPIIEDAGALKKVKFKNPSLFLKDKC